MVLRIWLSTDIFKLRGNHEGRSHKMKSVPRHPAASAKQESGCLDWIHRVSSSQITLPGTKNREER